jgi:hypothetical protein
MLYYKIGSWSYTERGYCGYGENCFFAYMVEELVIPQPILRKKM